MKGSMKQTDGCAPRLCPPRLTFPSLTLALILITLGSLFSDAGATNEDSLVPLLFVGPDGARPYIYSDDQQTTGILADISKEIGVRIDRPIRIRLLDFREARKMVHDGEADAVMPLGITLERKEQFDFTTPLFNIVFTVFARENETYPSDWPNIEGVRIGVFAKGTSRSLAEEWYPKATTVTVRGSEDAMRLVQQSAIDAMITTRRTGNQAIYQANIANVVALPITLSSTPAGIAVRKGNANLVAVINAAIDKLQAEGAIARILSRWEGTRVVLFSKQDIWVASGLTAVGVSIAFLLFGFFFLRQRRISAGRLLASEENLRTTLDSIGDAVIASDIDGKVTRMNPVAEKLTGWRTSEAIGKSLTEVFQIINATTKEPTIDPVRTVLETGTVVTLTNHTVLIAKGGEKYQIADSAAPIRDDHGDITGVVLVFRDVTDEYAVRTALETSEERYRRAARLTRMGHWVREEGKCIYCSEEMAEIYGVSVAEYLRRSMSPEGELAWFHPDDRPHRESVVSEAVRNKTGYETITRIVRDDEQVRYIHEVADGILDADGNLVQMAGVLHDITERKHAEETLAHQATHDALTGLINRRDFERRLARVLETTNMSQDAHALCYLALDQFKVINDTCGHLAGDELLRQLGNLLSATVRKRDTLARLGGDEFGVLMEHCSLSQARQVANKIRRAVAEFRFAWATQTFRVGVSIGLVPITETSESVVTLLSAADSACYAAKDKGRNRVHVYRLDDTELAHRQGEMQWVGRINQALEDNRFQLWSQPIVSINDETGSDEHFELLLRLVDEQGQIVPPGAFLPATERYGLSTKLDSWVVSTALRWLSRNPELLARLPMCCINLSGASLANEEFLVFMQEQLEQSGVPAGRICFEITETTAIANLSKAMTLMETLKARGCLFALDDFGSGISSFGYLKNLPVDYLKIDGMFVKDIAEDPIDYAMVKSINEIGQVMGMKTIAEFVENDGIKRMLQAIGVNYAQGYGLGKPEPLIDLITQPIKLYNRRDVNVTSAKPENHI